MCNLQVLCLRMLALMLSYLVAQTTSYPLQSWSMYPPIQKEYNDEDYYYPKVQHYYDAPAMNIPEVYGQMQYPMYDSYGHFENESPERQDERLAALPIGQETWFESENVPRWRSSEDDVSAAFLDNLVLTQMAQDAQRRRENARAAFPEVSSPGRRQAKDLEDEDVRELKALSGKPFYHVPKNVPRIEDDEDEDYPADDSFINWNGNKRNVKTTVAPATSSTKPREGQDEQMMAQPAPTNHRRQSNDNKRASNYYNTVSRLFDDKSATSKHHDFAKERKMMKRFVSQDRDLVLELQGLKRRIVT